MLGQMGQYPLMACGQPVRAVSGAQERIAAVEGNPTRSRLSANRLNSTPQLVYSSSLPRRTTTLERRDERTAAPRPNKQLSAFEYSSLKGRFAADDADYHLINGQHPVFGKRGVWDGDYTRQQYLRSVDHLIGVIDGTIAEREVSEPNHVRSVRPDVVVWLDKSARPASWFVDAFWEQIAVEGRIKPRYEFLRIDRRDWLSHMGYDDAQARNTEPKKVRIDKIPYDPILRIRALFCAEPLDRDNWPSQVACAPTTLDGLNILVVDETKVSGATLPIATGLLSRVAPTARVSGVHFWRDSTSRAVGGAIQPGTVPIWYPGETTTGEEITVYGRGIGNSSLAYWEQFARRRAGDPQSNCCVCGFGTPPQSRYIRAPPG